MKRIILFSLIGLLAACSDTQNESNTIDSKDSEDFASSSKIAQCDSLSIENELVQSPFETKDEYLYFKKKLKSSTKTIEELAPNKHDETVKDTLKTIYWGESYIQTLNNISIDKTMLLFASLKERQFSLKNNIRVGMSIDQVFKAFNIKRDHAKEYKLLEIKTPDNGGEMGFVSYLTLYFKKDTLSEIRYQPYID